MIAFPKPSLAYYPELIYGVPMVWHFRVIDCRGTLVFRTSNLLRKALDCKLGCMQGQSDCAERRLVHSGGLVVWEEDIGLRARLFS